MTPRKHPSDEQLREAFSEVGDALQRAVVLSSDRVQSVFEDAVLRGRMTRRDAEELASSLVALGRDQAQELRGDVDALARTFSGRVSDAVDAATEAAADVVPSRARTKRRRLKDAATEATPAEQAEAQRLVVNGHKATTPPASAGTLPANAATLPAKDLIALTPKLAPADLAALRAAEQAGKARATVLRAIDAKLEA